MKMSKDTREHLSALVDGEISRETSRFLVRRLGVDDELRATWTRYHLVRDCLRHQDGALAGEDLCARINQALADEQPGKPSRSLPTGWLKPVAGVAIAASVALMAIVALDSGSPVAPQPANELAGAAKLEQFTSPQSLTPAPYSSQASYSGQAAARGRKMDSYLVRHYQATGATGGRGFVTFVPIVITGSKTPNGTDGEDDSANPESGKDVDTSLR
jgi:sigma-E factor negative regulatory protein RseA